MIVGLILAGGASRRMGSPKALLRWQGETFLERQVRLLGLVASAVHVVTGTHDREIREALPSLDAWLHFNPQHEQGQFSSLRCGLEFCPPEASVLYWPVDFGAVAESTLRLLAGLEGAGLAKPTYQAKSGHPVLFGREARRILEAAPLTANAKELLATLPATKLPVEDAACVFDVDTPEDYERLLRGEVVGSR